MKSICLLLSLCLGICSITEAQICLFEFNGTGTCNPNTQGNSPTTSPPSTVTISPVTRYGPNLQCQAFDNVFATSGFTDEAGTTDNYIEISLQASPGYYINVSSVFLYASRTSSTSFPTNMRVAHDGTGAFNTSIDYSLSTTANSPCIWNSFLPFSSSSGGTVRFRIMAWNSNPQTNQTPSTGLLRLDNIAIYATVTTVPMSGLWISTSSSNIINTNTGTVGIGTSNPNTNAKLDVNGNIFTSGKLLIGTTNLAAVDNNILAVNGNAIFEKVKVRSYAIWPDYVFEEDYNLPSLDEVEAYLRKYKHLPNIITADEAKKNGVDLADNQAALLKKVEELTLYLIQLKKRMDQLSEENKKLSEKIETLEMLKN